MIARIFITKEVILLSKYTVMLRWLVESKYNLGLKDYPIFDEAYRNALNDKIIGHFYFREIGLETPDLFKRFLNRKMNEIMPYYNQLYESERIKIDPLRNVNLKEVYNKKNDGRLSQTDNTSTTNNETYNQNRDRNESYLQVDSDTPQSYINDTEILQNHYASYASRNNGDTGEKTSGNNDTVNNSDHDLEQNTNNTEEFEKTTTGLTPGTAETEMILKLRETFLNIDMLVISELESLFMSIW